MATIIVDLACPTSIFVSASLIAATAADRRSTPNPSRAIFAAR